MRFITSCPAEKNSARRITRPTWPSGASDAAGGGFFSWATGYEPHPGAFIQRLSSSGAILWQAGGVLLSITGSNHPSIASDGTGGAVIVWTDARSTQEDLYA